MKAQFIIGSFGVIFDEQKRVLLVHRCDYDLWNLPGGTLEDFESPADAVKREVKEETLTSLKQKNSFYQTQEEYEKSHYAFTKEIV